MKRLFLATCLTSALVVLGVTAVPAGAVNVHPLSSSARAKLAHHSKRGHKLSAAQLRKDKAGAARLLKSLKSGKSHKAHAAQTYYYGSVWSDPMDPYYLTDEDTTCDGVSDYGGAEADPGCYSYSYSDSYYDNSDCAMITSYTFTYGLYSCEYMRQDVYEDISNGVYYYIQLICGTYSAGQASDPASYGCQYADTYSVESASNGNLYGLFTYEN